MTTCPAYVDLGAYEPTEFWCERRIDHAGKHFVRDDNGVDVVWVDSRASWPFTGPRLPHVHNDSCGSFCRLADAYLNAMVDNAFSSRPLLFALRSGR